jgi:hypothetical protein
METYPGRLEVMRGMPGCGELDSIATVIIAATPTIAVPPVSTAPACL